MSPLQFKIYQSVRRKNEYVAGFRYAEDCASFLANCGGGTVKWMGKVVFKDPDGSKSAESYDIVGATIRHNAGRVQRGERRVA